VESRLSEKTQKKICTFTPEKKEIYKRGGKGGESSLSFVKGEESLQLVGERASNDADGEKKKVPGGVQKGVAFQVVPEKG